MVEAGGARAARLAGFAGMDDGQRPDHRFAARAAAAGFLALAAAAAFAGAATGDFSASRSLAAPWAQLAQRVAGDGPPAVEGLGVMGGALINAVVVGALVWVGLRRR